MGGANSRIYRKKVNPPLQNLLYFRSFGLKVPFQGAVLYLRSIGQCVSTMLLDRSFSILCHELVLSSSVGALSNGSLYVCICVHNFLQSHAQPNDEFHEFQR